MIHNQVNDHDPLLWLKKLFLFIFDQGNVGHEMWCQVLLMSMAMKFGRTHQGPLCEQFFDIESQWEKVSQRSIVARGHTDHNLEPYECFTQNVLSHMRSFLFRDHISFCCFFALKQVRHHNFWTHLKMCIVIFDLLPLILNNVTVSGEMRS